MVATGSDSKTLAAGSKCPDLKPNVLYVYNMRFCPYAERALLALSYKDVPHTIINIDLKKKPEWYLADKNPLGKVPTVQLNDKIVYESLVCAEYVDQLYPDKPRLLPADPYEAAKQKMLLERLSQLVSAFYGMYQGPTDETKLQALRDALTKNEALLKGDYFAGAQPGYADYMIFPHYERIPTLEILANGKVALEQMFPKTAAYIKRMLARPEVARVAKHPQFHAKFLKMMISGGPVDYDITED